MLRWWRVWCFVISPYSQIPWEWECLNFPSMWQLQFWENGRRAQSRMQLGTPHCPSTSHFITCLFRQIIGQWNSEAKSKSWNECPLLLFAPLKKNSPHLSYEGNKLFSSPKPPDQLWGIPSLAGAEHLVHEANQTPPGNVKVNLQYAIMTCTGTTIPLPLILSLIA